MSDHAETTISREAVVAWMVEHVATVLGKPRDGFPVDDTFDSYGIDSVEAVIMAGLMEEHFGRPIDPINMFDHPSIVRFADFYAGQSGTDG